jgi:hypothetical protein
MLLDGIGSVAGSLAVGTGSEATAGAGALGDIAR